MFITGLLFCITIGLLSGPIGSFILWRKLAFFAEMIAHASLTGVVVHYFLGCPLEVAMAGLALGYCCLLYFNESRKLSFSSFMPIYSYGLMSASLIIIDKVIRQNSITYTMLLGDVLLISPYELLLLTLLTLLTYFFWFFFKKGIILMVFSEEMAIIRNYPVRLIAFFMNLLVALSIAFLVQGVGVLLCLSLLTIPALTAFRLSRNPTDMVRNASLLGVCVSVLGYNLAWIYNMPIGPTIGALAMLTYLLVKLFLKVHKTFSIIE